ncbi:glucosamine-6-phosphate deaminase 1 [Abditibacteriota bacterium]|nr:glucosamine-6-phosphate deaminase 1 [Abditibacteriota bacterium]
MNLEIRADYPTLCREVAARIADLVRRKPDAVLGLATGSTPTGIYEELIRLHKEEGLSFARVQTFNLDEYFPLAPDAPQSYRRFMNEQLFAHIDIAPENTHVPDGRARSIEQVEAYCRAYEEAIAAAGGIDFQLLGIGRTGHIGFNEPGSAQESRTRLVVLDYLTRNDAAGDFFGIENVPARALTMGVGTIFEAREIALVASGRKKAEIVVEALTGKITSKVPASFLREHPGTTFWLDENAATELPERQLAASGGPQAIIRAALERRMPLWSLDGFETGQIAEVEANLKRRMDDDAMLPANKMVLCLSPHPDDDVICCGATILKLAARGNRVYVAYGVSGANAVRDKDVLALLRARHPRLIAYLEENLEPGKSLEDAVNEVRFSIFEREAGAADAPLLRELKRLVREGEAADACRKMGAKPIFLNLPFYGDGANRRAPNQADWNIMHEALQRVKPDVVMLTGELSDPHGTHEVCEQVFERVAQPLEASGDLNFERWLYRGSYLEWRVEEASYFSVFGKKEMDAKIGLILDHISQLDPLFPGGDAREFWERARDRNRQSARELQTLGLLPASRSFDPLFAELFRVVP